MNKVSLSYYRAIRGCIVFLGWSFITTVMAQNSTIEGRISSIKNGFLVIEEQTLPLGGPGQSVVIPGREMCIKETRYFTPNGYPTSFETLAGVGYVEKARVLVEQGCVLEVRVVEMQQ